MNGKQQEVRVFLHLTSIYALKVIMKIAFQRTRVQVYINQLLVNVHVIENFPL